MENKRIMLLAETGVAVALSAVLGMVNLYRMPQGGSISLEMLPILILAVRWGGVPGMITGLVYGFVQLIIDAYVVHPVQFLLDYPAAYMLVGLAGFIRIKDIEDKKSSYVRIAGAVLLGGCGRFLAHLITGVIFFGSYAPEGQNPWIYSFIYNISYIIPSIIISYIIIIPLLKPLFNYK